MARDGNLVNRQPDLEGGALAHLTLDFDPSPVALDDVVSDRQTQSGAALFGGKEGIKDVRERGGVNPRAGVGDRHQDVASLGRVTRADRELAVAYLKAAMEDTEEPSVLLSALRNIAEARGGVAKVAREAGMDEVTLKRALSGRMSRQLVTLNAVAKAIGFRVTVEPMNEAVTRKRKSA